MIDVSELNECPNCGTNWVGQEIPEADRELFGNYTHFQRGPIGVEYRSTTEDYDGVSEWECPDCKTRWGRWTGKVLKEGELEPRYGNA